jgi:RNA polymerase sigma factor (sigma-70 family)
MKDEQLIWDTFRFGDESSFRMLFEEYYTRLFNYGHKFSADDHLIQDALQDLFTRLWKNRENIRETGSVRNYLYKSFRRVLLRMLEVHHRKYEFSPLVEVTHPATEFGYDETMISRERLEAVRVNLARALEKMTPRQREIIHLRYYAELEYEEIAVVMQLSAASTYKLLYKAIDTLRQYLSRKDLYILYSLLSLKNIY